MRKAHIVAVEVDDVELLGRLRDASTITRCAAIGSVHSRIEPKRPRAGRDQMGPGDGVSTGEQRHVVPEVHQLFGQVRDHSFRSAVETGRHGLVEWRHLQLILMRRSSFGRVVERDRRPVSARRSDGIAPRCRTG